MFVIKEKTHFFKILGGCINSHNIIINWKSLPIKIT